MFQKNSAFTDNYDVGYEKPIVKMAVRSIPAFPDHAAVPKETLERWYNALNDHHVSVSPLDGELLELRDEIYSWLY